MKLYHVVETFFSVQGEGAQSGTPCVFVRFAGCNGWSGRDEDRATAPAACGRWCDTKFFDSIPMTLEEIVAATKHAWPERLASALCVLTGGEPLLQLDESLVVALHDARFRVAVETNGSVANDALSLVDWLTVSPKRGLPCKLRAGHELKVVLPGCLPDDPRGDWCDEEFAELGKSFGQRFVQPCAGATGGAEYASVLRCLEFVRANPSWRISIQAHKVLSLP